MLERIFPKEVMLFIGVMWGVYILDLIVPGISFNHFGIMPRKLEGLMGIFISPFLHGGWSHILSNTVPLLVLAALVRVSLGSRKMCSVIFIGAVGSGLGAWVFSSGDLVIGASGIVFALLGFLFADAYFSPSLRSWSVAISGMVLYGGTLMSLFVYLPFISWASHFWGLVAGVASAVILRKHV
ncbi:MAG: rhomboid family intramembrane serine protease [Pseudomonadota bacterium]